MLQEDKKQKAVLVSVDTGDFDAEESLEELEALAKAAELQPIVKILQKREHCDSATCVGQGKLAELIEILNHESADIIIFDRELTGSQLRNLEQHCGIPVVDRTMLILDIFAARAKSNEGRIQVELAQYQYMLPRLYGMGNALSRQAGGIGARGPGESKLETDRRHIQRRINSLKKELSQIQARRQRLRKRREKDRMQTVALVGYTNVGKSTLLNKLTAGGAKSQNCLFATLDTTSRLMQLPDGREALLIDTVGFLRRLPHSLIEAFSSTLEEISTADVIVHVVNAADPKQEEQRKTVVDLLEQLKCIDIPILTVYNQADRLPDIAAFGEKGVFVSAHTGFGLPELLARISDALPCKAERHTFRIPYKKASLVAKVRNIGNVFAEEFCDDGILLDATVDSSLIPELHLYITEEGKS